MNSLHTTNGDDCGCTSWIYALGAVGALCFVAAVVIIILLVYIKRLHHRRSRHSTARVSKGHVATTHQQDTIDADHSWDATSAPQPATMNNRCKNNTNTAKPKATKNGFDSLGYSVAEQARHDFLMLQNRDNNNSNNNHNNVNTADDGYLRPQCATAS